MCGFVNMQLGNLKKKKQELMQEIRAARLTFYTVTYPANWNQHVRNLKYILR